MRFYGRQSTRQLPCFLPRQFYNKRLLCAALYSQSSPCHVQRNVCIGLMA